MLSSILLMGFAAGAQAQTGDTFWWKYYRPGNTGIQGDYNDAMLIGADNDPWIGGYDPGFEEGGIAKFVQAENRWINISNIDHPEIGHPEDTGVARVSEIVSDGKGGLWMGTGRGALYYKPSLGPISLKRFDATNSGMPGGWTQGVEIAPDGTIWFTGYSTVWGNGGLTQYNPATGVWTPYEGFGNGNVSVQPKPGGGYYVWTGGSQGGFARFDSTTQTWAEFGILRDAPSALPGKACTDAAGNTWMYRFTDDSPYFPILDCMRPDGTWMGANVPNGAVPENIWVFRAYGNKKALLIDGGSFVWQFNGTTWTNLGNWKEGPWSYDVGIDRLGNVWACGMGGAAKRDVLTGRWQRYRITNTSQYDLFNNDISLDPKGGLYSTANAGPGYGGMVRFDGVRWTGVNNYTYGLGYEWPFPSDNSERIYVRPSNGEVLVNPMYGGLFNFNAGTWTDLLSPVSSPKDMAEDSLGRLWMVAYGTVALKTDTGWKNISDLGGFRVRRDPSRIGAVWALNDTSLLRTNGVYKFKWTIESFPELDPQSDSFKGIAVAKYGIVWIGANTIGLPDSGRLIRLDTNTGKYTIYMKNAVGPNAIEWPFPGEYVMPLGMSPDGRVWMQYDSEYLTALRGLCWFDGTNVGQFPAPPNGEAQWGGLPHAGITDFEVKRMSYGYQLWMVCASRGIAVLNVKKATL